MQHPPGQWLRPAGEGVRVCVCVLTPSWGKLKEAAAAAFTYHSNADKEIPRQAAAPSQEGQMSLDCGASRAEECHNDAHMAARDDHLVISSHIVVVRAAAATCMRVFEEVPRLQRPPNNCNEAAARNPVFAACTCQPDNTPLRAGAPRDKMTSGNHAVSVA